MLPLTSTRSGSSYIYSGAPREETLLVLSCTLGLVFAVEWAWQGRPPSARTPLHGWVRRYSTDGALACSTTPCALVLKSRARRLERRALRVSPPCGELPVPLMRLAIVALVKAESGPDVSVNCGILRYECFIMFPHETSVLARVVLRTSRAGASQYGIKIMRGRVFVSYVEPILRE